MFFKKEQNNELEWIPTFENQYADYRVQVVYSLQGDDISLIGGAGDAIKVKMKIRRQI